MSLGLSRPCAVKWLVALSRAEFAFCRSRWLLRVRDLCGGETLPLTQEFLAQSIGVQRNAISIVAHALQRAGITSCRRGSIDITNADGLRETACERYAAVKARHRRLLKFSH